MIKRKKKREIEWKKKWAKGNIKVIAWNSKSKGKGARNREKRNSKECRQGKPLTSWARLDGLLRHRLTGACRSSWTQRRRIRRAEGEVRAFSTYFCLDLLWTLTGEKSVHYIHTSSRKYARIQTHAHTKYMYFYIREVSGRDAHNRTHRIRE